MSWHVPREAKSRILAGNYAPIVVDKEPKTEVGSKHILSWSRPKPFVDPELKATMRPHPEPLFWITLTRIECKTKGGWAVYFDTYDRRDPSRLMRRGYGDTSNPRDAIDHLDKVDAGSQKKITEESGERAVESAGRVLKVLAQLREVAVREIEQDPEAAKLMGRDARTITDKIDAVERRLKRRAA